MASLALVSGTAGITGSAEREARRSRDGALAAALRQSGVQSFVEDWYRQPLWRSLRAHPRSAPLLPTGRLSNLSIATPFDIFLVGDVQMALGG